MVLRAATLSLEALLVGGVLFLIAVAVPGGADERALRACRRGMEWVALAMVLAQLASLTVQALLVVGHTGITAATGSERRPGDR